MRRASDAIIAVVPSLYENVTPPEANKLGVMVEAIKKMALCHVKGGH
jgi:hypothetical protein